MKKQGACVLLVEDECEIVRLLQRVLAAQDFPAFTKTCAVDILEELTYYRPDLAPIELHNRVRHDLEGQRVASIALDNRASSGALPTSSRSPNNC